MAQKAVKMNLLETGKPCRHICIEPYEMPWLEQAGVTVIRLCVEDCDKAIFSELEENDLLFIDSSHVARPEGDVLYEYLELLPTLNKGVIVHIHDIFSPRDYAEDWLTEEIRMWDEQYILEAFLSCNSQWKVIAAVNMLHNDYYEELKAVCPFLERTHRPASFYIQSITSSSHCSRRRR